MGNSILKFDEITKNIGLGFIFVSQNPVLGDQSNSGIVRFHIIFVNYFSFRS